MMRIDYLTAHDFLAAESQANLDQLLNLGKNCESEGSFETCCVKKLSNIYHCQIYWLQPS